MRPGAIALAVVFVLLASAEASAVDTYSTSQFRKIVAQATVPDRNNEQLYFSVVAGTFWTNEIHKLALSDGVYYQFSSTVYLTADGKTKILEPGDGVFLPAGTQFSVEAVDMARPPTYLQFLLSPNPGSDVPGEVDGQTVELYRSPGPVPGLTRTRNLLSLTRVPVPPQSPPDPLHKRSGAALHYVLSGVGAEFGEGNAAARGPGSVSYQPAGFTYQWSNPGLQPLIYLVFNVNPKDIEPVIVQDQQPDDPFSRDPHLTLAIYCVAISMFLTLMVMSGTIADYHREKRRRLDRDDDRAC
jgi:mannose-6-phosphate isomerase-like protein (cupin superfamily)